MDTFTCASEHTDDSIAVVAIAREFDLKSRGMVRDVLEKLAAEHLVIDLSGVTFMDASGVGVSISVHRQGHGALSVVATTPQVLPVLRYKGLSNT